MNRLEILMKKWKEGVHMNPDLHLCLKVIDNLTRELHEATKRESENKQRVSGDAGESNNPEPKRSKAKGLRTWFQGGSGGISQQDKNSL